MKEHSVTIPLPETLRRFLEARAVEQDRSMASAARQILAAKAARAARRSRVHPNAEAA